jgi:radical SAM superfamily enzyme YgiQ (UPF0313 family)
MKISISFPPLESEKGIPLLSQNRQFQWFSNPTYIYPMIPAYAASLLQARGHEVFWDDGIAEELSYEAWLARIKKEQPDLIMLESKTPVIKRHWKIIRDLKALNLNLNLNLASPITVLVGDHVTALPQESLESSPVDYVITGGDFDFVLADLCDYLSSSSQSQPEPKPHHFLPSGIWYRQNSRIISSGAPDRTHDLNALPLIDRDLTKWPLYAYKNGNFKYTPGTYIMAGRDCWWGRCSFCSWTTLCPGETYRTVDVDRHLDEVGNLIENYGFREIFDDSGCFPKGKWLEEFCKGVIDRGYNKQATFGCNMRCGALSPEQWRLMKQANFRFILIGLESVNQDTLDRLNKGIKVEQIEKTIKDCKEAGLMPHITVMVGYPWESKQDAEKTIAFAKRMFTKGYIDSLQATIVVPYPGTPMFEESRENGWLLTEDWDDYDMKQSVWKSPVTNDDVLRYTQDLYRAALHPAFIARKLASIRSLDDFKFLARAGTKVLAHIADFRKNIRR